MVQERYYYSTAMKLSDPIRDHFRLVHTQGRALKKLGIETIRDLLYHLPTRYENLAGRSHVADLRGGERATLFGKLGALSIRRAFRKHTPIAEGVFEDESGRIKVMWFNQPYIAKMFHEGTQVKLSGKVVGKEGNLYIANPEIETVSSIPLGTNDSLFADKRPSGLYPQYSESRGVTSRWFFHAIGKILRSGLLETLEDPIPSEILSRYHLPVRKTALLWIHVPKKEGDATAARKRFAFEEVFFIQLAAHRERAAWNKQPSFNIRASNENLKAFTKRFPFELTNAQERAISVMLDDFRGEYPMGRLLEGDVGSGKTAVAATVAYTVSTTAPYGSSPAGEFGNLQVAYMAPTEILAKQHFDSFIELFSHLPIQIGLITGSGCKKFPSKVNQSKATDISRTQLLKWVANGEIPILIGTHALIEKSVTFKHLAFVIIDEQHRFGTLQRQKLVRKHKIVPHLLSMTATPIPRTLALTIYGDLDLTLLDEMPKGRKQIITDIVLPEAREKTYEKIREELKSGRQAYVICPRINEPDPTKAQALNVKSVKEEAKRLKKDIFPEYEIAILHSKLTPKEKDRTMQEFLANEIQILVATSVVEVGVNIQNATVIIIEGAERFGLAQLHQLRGRVLRSTNQAYCFVFADTKSKHSLERLKALKTAKNGFELAERDLEMRGSGELYGRKQWGLSDVAMEAMKNIKMVEAARAEAKRLIDDDAELKHFPLLRETLEERVEKLHFE